MSIRGVVVDDETHLPVEAASVELRFSSSSQQPSLKLNQSDFDSAAPAVEREVTVSIARAAAITGVLKDGKTQKPLADFRKGAFRLKTAPGDYLLEVWKTPAANTPVAGRLADYTAKAPAPMGDPETALRLVVGGGVELGTINLSKIAMGRVRSSVLLSQCAEGGMVQVPCGSAFTLANLSPGDYIVVGMALGPHSYGGFAWGPNRPACEVVPVKPADDPLPASRRRIYTSWRAAMTSSIWRSRAVSS